MAGQSSDKPLILLDGIQGFQISEAFTQALQEMVHHPKFIESFGFHYSDERLEQGIQRDVEHWETHGFGILVWVDSVSGAFVGKSGLRRLVVENSEAVELNYTLCYEYWGKGLATQIGQAAMDFGFQRLRIDATNKKPGTFVPGFSVSQKTNKRLRL